MDIMECFIKKGKKKLTQDIIINKINNYFPARNNSLDFTSKIIA